MEKRRNCSLGAISPLFHNIFNISLTWESNYIFILLKVVVRLIVFLISANLICRSTDISKCFMEFLGVRDNESRLYVVMPLAFTPVIVVNDTHRLSNFTSTDIILKLLTKYIEDIQMFGVNMTFISSSEVKKCIFHECRRHE